VCVTVLVTALFTIWFTYPKTRGHSLEEMVVVFEWDEADIPSSKEVLENVEHNEAYNRSKSVVSHVERPGSTEKVAVQIRGRTEARCRWLAHMAR